MPDIFPENSFVGIDIGTRWVKVVELRKGKGGVVVSKVARKEIVTPESDTPDQRQKASIATLMALLKENGISSRKVVLGLPGHQIFVRKMRLPATTEERLSKIVLYEARQQIPFPLDKIQLDYHVKPIPDSQEVEVLLVGSKREIISEYIKFVKDSGINAKYLDVTPVALFNLQKYIDPALSQEATALINIGAATTDISIVRDGWLSFTRTAPVAGNDLTRNIAKTLNIDFTAAEQIKLKQGRVPLEYEVSLGIDEAGGSEEEQKTRQAITTALDRLVGEIRRTFDYYISQPDGVAISRVIISGGTSQLENIDGYIGEKLAMPVTLIKNLPDWEHLQEFRDQFGDELPWATTAAGLALRSSSKIPNLIRIDFLPQEVKDIRAFTEKRLQISIATALLLIVVFMGSLFGSDEIVIKQQQTTELINRTNKAAKGYNKYKELDDRNNKLSGVYNDLWLVFGKRDYWLNILTELNKITPSDVWFTRVQCGRQGAEYKDEDAYKLTIEGRSLSDGSVTAFATNLGKSSYVAKEGDKETGKPLVKPLFISTPTLDPRLDKTVTSFTFEVTCKPPKAYIPRETGPAK